MKPSEYALHDPIAAIATALVPSALGIVRTSGAGSIELASAAFSRSEALLKAEGNTLVHGWILAEDGTRIDEVMAAVYRAPRSFTGEDSVEFTGHGGPAAVLEVYKRLLQAGFRGAERGEFTFRSFVHGKCDLTRAEAVREIIEARTGGARSRAAGRLSGSLEREIEEARKIILSALAAIEVEIEYPEDEETTAGAWDPALTTAALEKLKILESTWSSERLYREGARVVIAGKTNAGKSSLFNALLKEERAIVSDIHGTTRDWLESGSDFAGIPVNLYDTAGIRHTADAVEAEGVQRSLNLASEADVLIYLVDSTAGMTAEDRALLNEGIQGDATGSKAPVVIAWNKADKPGTLAPPEPGSLGAETLVQISAKTGTGISDLVRAAAGILMEKAGGATRANSAALGSERQKAAVHSAVLALDHAFRAAEQGFPMDAIAQDLEDALGALGEITGETTPADILDEVFSGFCVGK